jgi:hypothetical protein
MHSGWFLALALAVAVTHMANANAVHEYRRNVKAAKRNK